MSLSTQVMSAESRASSTNTQGSPHPRQLICFAGSPIPILGASLYPDLLLQIRNSQGWAGHWPCRSLTGFPDGPVVVLGQAVWPLGDAILWLSVAWPQPELHWQELPVPNSRWPSQAAS